MNATGIPRGGFSDIFPTPASPANRRCAPYDRSAALARVGALAARRRILGAFAMHEGFADVLRGIPQAGVTMLWLVRFTRCPCYSMHADGVYSSAASRRCVCCGG